MNKIIAHTLFLAWPTALFANEPKDWQLGFQKSASQTMTDLGWVQDYMLLPIITGITAFVLLNSSITFFAQNKYVIFNCKFIVAEFLEAIWENHHSKELYCIHNLASMY